MAASPPTSDSAPADPPPRPSSASNHHANDDPEADSENDNDEDNEDDDPEPNLKYSRLTGDLPTLLLTDAISAATCTDKFLLLGTYSGHVHVVDYSGTIIQSLSHHRSSVSAVCIDSTQEFVASAGEDGRVIIAGLFANDVRPFEFRRPIKCLALDPEYAKTSRFVAGGHAGEVAMFERRWTGPRKSVLDTVEGSVLAVAWRAALVAYVTEVGFGLYDVRGARIVCKSHVPFFDERPDMFRPHLVWKSDEVVVVGWQKVVQIVEVKPAMVLGMGYNASITIQATVEPVIGGIQPFQTNYLILGVWDPNDPSSHSHGNPTSSESDTDDQPTLRTPETLLLDPSTPLSPLLARDLLSIRNHDRYPPTAFSMLHVPDDPAADSMYLLVSPKDVITVRPRDVNDRIEWMLERGRYEEAVALSADATQSKNGLVKPEFRLVELGQRVLGELVDAGEVQRAAGLCGVVLGKSHELWERWVALFLEVEAIDAILDVVPVHNPVLDHTLYEVILAHALSTDFAVFRRLIDTWPTDIYTVPTVLTALEDTLTDFPTDRDLLHASVKLYAHEKLAYKQVCSLMALDDFSSAVSLLDSHAPITSPLIRQRGIEWLALCDRHYASDLTRMLQSHAIHLLVSRTHLVDPVDAAHALAANRKYLFVYLYALYTRDAHMGAAGGNAAAAHQLHGDLLDLIAEYRPASLLEFLKRSVYYPLDRALALTEKKGMLREMVYVLGRMGDHKRALVIMMDRMDDIEMAIEYAKQQQDHDLWDDLLEFAVHKPKYWAPLFKSTNLSIDPIRLIRRVPRGAQIPGLKDLLTSIVRDFTTQVEVRGQARNVLRHDVIQFMSATMRKARGGVPVDHLSRCVACGLQVGRVPKANVSVEVGTGAVAHVGGCPAIVPTVPTVGMQVREGSVGVSAAGVTASVASLWRGGGTG
ncbi:hypothetical protein BCR44DRAFT_148290 [Catenaria anguillulae PL171]|uniref:Vps41 beta-propeller domain-containing protein n=1 Tax=Catenaria anguillulae PL171 TaxID=765915 RepID=A0A1Y2HAY1_9FUNG|nr:hypothetical protein BCR44DRAFT_148290 [Catenaria anguillulae PL171]